jgi:hypothetical protein
MSIFDLLKPKSSRMDLALAELLKGVAKAADDKIYNPDFEPEGGWDKWCAWAAKQGKIARMIRSLAKNAMAFDFSGDDDKALELVQKMRRRTHLDLILVLAFKDWLEYGRCFLEVVWEKKRIGNNVVEDIIKIKRVNPMTVRVFRDNEDDVRELRDFLKRHFPNVDRSNIKEGSGDNIIGFVQHFKRAEEGKAVFFKPEELIFIPRYPDYDAPDGVSLLRENYANIMNKLGTEKYQAIMLKRFVDHKHKFKVPERWWHRIEELQSKIKNMLKAGGDLWIPEGMEVEILEPKGNPLATIKAQEHIEDQVIAGMGFSDSFTESKSSNRSVGEVQLQFFERDIRPERYIFKVVIEDRIIIPYVRKKLGPKAKPPEMVFEDLTPRDEVRWAAVMASYLPYMTKSQIKRLFDELGYPVPKEEEKEFSAKVDLATQKGVPKPVLTGSVDVREEFAEEIHRLRKELLEVFD